MDEGRRRGKGIRHRMREGHRSDEREGAGEGRGRLTKENKRIGDQEEQR